MELDRIPLWRGDHVALKQLAEDYAQYLYLPRLRDSHVLERAVEDGLGVFSWDLDAFAYVQGYDEATGRYGGLTAGQGGTVSLDGSSVPVKPEAAKRQFAADREVQAAGGGQVSENGGGYAGSGGGSKPIGEGHGVTGGEPGRCSTEGD